jgi:hypothetical protein
LPLHVAGNRLENAAGRRVVLHGTDVSGSGYQCERAGNGFSDTPTGDSLYAPMVGDAGGTLAQDWRINSVALGINQDCWLGLYGVNPAYSGQNYIDYVKGEVSSMEKYGIYPVIGIGNGAPYGPPNWYGTNNGALPMPNDAHMSLLWEEMANTFKSDPKVIFRLFEEPYPNWASGPYNLAAWNCWSQGDVQYSVASVRVPPVPPVPVSSVTHCHEVDQESPAVGYQAVGMQSLVNIIRGTGATNVIQIPGVTYANMLACDPHGDPTVCGFLDNNPADCTSCAGGTIEVHDSLVPAQLMADTDNYPDSGQYCGSIADPMTCVTDTYDPVAAVMPMDMGEAGSGTGGMSVIQQLVDHYDSLGQSYYGSQWETWSGFITSYAGTPGPGFGTWYHDHIASLG